MSPNFTSVLALLSLTVSQCRIVAGQHFEPKRIAQIKAHEQSAHKESARSSSNCFPAIGFSMPSSIPSSLTDWWCSTDTEYGFVGFSYEVTACKSS